MIAAAVAGNRPTLQPDGRVPSRLLRAADATIRTAIVAASLALLTSTSVASY